MFCLFWCSNISAHLTFILQKAKHVGIVGEGKAAVVKLAMTADVHCSAQSQPSDPQVPEGQEVVDAAETSQTTGAMATSSKTAELGTGA